MDTLETNLGDYVEISNEHLLECIFTIPNFINLPYVDDRLKCIYINYNRVLLNKPVN